MSIRLRKLLGVPGVVTSRGMVGCDVFNGLSDVVVVGRWWWWHVKVWRG